MEINPYSDLCYREQLPLWFIEHNQVLQWNFVQTHAMWIGVFEPPELDPLEILARCFSNRAKKRGDKASRHTWSRKGYEFSRRR